MNMEHMRRLCGWHFTLLGVANLRDFEFGADGRGYANIRPKDRSRVLGVLYELDQRCLDTLDEFEGYPEVFNRAKVQVEDENGDSFEAWVYIENSDLFDGDYIKGEYLNRVILGATQNHLPKDWIKFLSSFQH